MPRGAELDVELEIVGGLAHQMGRCNKPIDSRISLSKGPG